MTDEKDTVDLGIMPAQILEDTEDIQLFFVAEMDTDTGDIIPSTVDPEDLEKTMKKYKDALIEHTDATREEVEKLFSK